MASELNVNKISGHTLPVGSAELVASDSAQTCKAWVNFNGVPATGTYAQSGTLVTVTITAHGMETGMICNLDFTSGTAVDILGAVITVTGVNTFTYVASTSISTSGNVTRNCYIRKAYNVSSITDNGVGDYTVNFTTAMVDADYSVAAIATANTTGTDANSGFGIKPTSTGATTGSGNITTSWVRLQNKATGAFDVDVATVSIFR